MSCISKVLKILIICLMIASTVNALEVYTTPELNSDITPNTDVNFSIIITGYPTPYNGTINIMTDLVSPNFIIKKGEGNININSQGVSISDIKSSEIQIQISGKTPIGKESKYVKVFDKYLKFTKFNTGPYNYYVVKMVDSNGNVVDKKMGIFNLEFKELLEYNNLYNSVENEKIKEIAKQLFDSYQVDTAIELLKAYKEVYNEFQSQIQVQNQGNQGGSSELILISIIVSLVVGVVVGILIGKKMYQKIKPGDNIETLEDYENEEKL